MPNEHLFSEFSAEEIKLIKSLNSPKKIQDFLNSIEANFEESGDTCYSPLSVLRKGKAHCMEGALLAAAILYYHNQEPLILDLEATPEDFDHVITLFKQHGYWGAIGKTNHAVLRYREPVYKTPRELVMSFFHEYFLNSNGKKTLRTFSNPVNLKRFDKFNWISSEEQVWFIPDYLTKIPHNKILNRKQIMSLRPADKIEIEAGLLTEYKKDKNKNI